MLEPFNDASIKQPPVMTYSCDTYDYADLVYICKEISRILSKQSALHKEGAILSRFIYKYDKKFRNDIGFRQFKKVNTALRRYLSLNFVTIIENFAMNLPSSDSEEVYLPSRQLLQFVLIKLMTFTKLMARITICSKQASVFYLDRIKRGESHWMSLMPYAVMCRIWSMCSVLLSYGCNWYNQLYKHHDKLQILGVQFLPDNYNLPSDLKVWLDVQNFDEEGRYNWAFNKIIAVASSLAEDEETSELNIFEFAKEINDLEDEIEIIKQKEVPIETDCLILYQKSAERCNHVKNINIKEDKGSAVSRDAVIKHLDQVNSLDKETPAHKKIKKSIDIPMENKAVNKHSHSSENVTGKNSLLKFLYNEEEFRNQGSELSLTKHLSFMQWQALQKSVMKLSNNYEKRKIQRKFQRIWKEMCTDYL